MTPWMSCRFPAEAGRDRDRVSRAAGQRLTPTPAPISSVIPAEVGIQRPKTRHSPLDSRLRGNDGNREVGEPECDCPGDGAGGELARLTTFDDASGKDAVRERAATASIGCIHLIGISARRGAS